MKKRFKLHAAWLLIACGITAWGLLPAVGRAAETGGQSGINIDVVGTGIMEQGDVASGKKAAIDNGLALAVDEVLRRVVPADILAANFADLDAAVNASLQQCILNYQVLAVTQRDTLCRVMVRASVSADYVRRQVQQAGVLADREMVPGVLVLLSEAGDKDSTGGRSAYQAVSESFAKRGFRPVAGPETGLLKENAPVVPEADLSISRAVDMGREMGADFVVIGHVAATSVAGSGRETKKGPRASVDARVVSVDTGLQLFSLATDVESVDGDAGPADREKALAAAGLKAAQGLSPSIVAAWEKQKSQTRIIDMTVRGAGYLAQLGTFRSALQSVRTVKRVQIREMKIDEALMTVAASGEMEALAREIGAIRTDGFYVQVTDVSDKGITVELIPDGH